MEVERTGEKGKSSPPENPGCATAYACTYGCAYTICYRWLQDNASSPRDPSGLLPVRLLSECSPRVACAPASKAEYTRHTISFTRLVSRDAVKSLEIQLKHF